MGQYWKIYNETKMEMLSPWSFDEAAKLREWPTDGPGGIQSALIILLLEESSLGEGGGDWVFDGAPDKLDDFIGHWRGDRISIIGDYSHLPEFSDNNMDDDWEAAYSDISDSLRALMQHEPCLATQEPPRLAPDMIFGV